MSGSLRLVPLLFALLVPAALAQVQDDFSDGDFTSDPPWTGETDRFTVVPFGADFALRSDGIAANDTIYLATASEAAFGRWAFTFRYEANLTNANGTRVYLVADTPELEGEVFGYYVQIGTNNSDEIRLYRQNGPATSRVVVGASEGPVAPDTEGTLGVEVLRDPAGRWQVSVDGVTVIAGVQDATYSESAALGVWLKHSTANGAAFFWDDIVADPDVEVDLGGPVPQSVTVLDGGATLLVHFDEVLAAGTIVPENFSLSDVGPPNAATLAGDGTVAELTFAPPIPEGDYVLSIEGVEDLDGNPVAPGTTISFTFETDSEPPELVSAEAASPTRVDVTFNEPVQGCDAALYTITPDVGQPAGIECPPGGDGETYGLLLGPPLSGPRTYTVIATDVADLAGNFQPETSASFFFGAFDEPAPGEIVINEIMYDPPDLAANEYVELFNRTTDRTFDLSALTLADDNDNPVPVTATPTALGPGAYAVLVRNADAFEAAFPGVDYVLVAGFPALNNTGDTPTIRFEETVLDAVPYVQSWGGRDAALERRSPAGPSAVSSNWATSTDPRGGTPGEPNSVPPDEEAPVPTDADLAPDGRTLTVFFDEPLDPATVTPAAFSIGGGPAVTAAEYLGDADPAVRLTLAEAPAPGTYTLTINGVADLLGNATQNAQIEFTYDPDVTPPALVAAAALDATTVEATFSEPVDPASAGDPANYEISDGIGRPASAEPDGRRVTLTLATPLAEQQQYTLVARNIADLAGNVQPETSASFFFGAGDAPVAGDLVVNEIMYDPPDLAANEYVELVNTSERTFDLRDFTFSDLTNTTRIATAPRFVLPGEYAVLVRDAAAFEAAFPGVPYVAVSGFPSLNNTGDAVVIAYEVEDTERIVADSVRFQPGWGGSDAALERRDPLGPSNSGGNWGTSLDPRGGTPGEPNSVPPDTTPPAPDDVEVTNDGLTLTVLFTELLDPATVTPGAFSIDDAVTPVEATYSEDDAPTVTLTLASPLSPGAHTLTVTGVSDLQGNTAEGESIAFTFSPDRTPPALLGASAPDSVRVEVVFSEDLGEAAADPARYAISEGIVVTEAELDGERVVLTLGTALDEGVVYTLTVTGIPDVLGNVLDEASTRFVLGGGVAPAPGQLVVTEIMYDLPSARNAEEYVELYNAADVPFDLSTLTLSDTGTPGALVGAPTLLLPGEYLAIVADAAVFRARFPEAERFVQAGRFPSLNNTGDAVVIRLGDVVIDSVFYDASWQRPELRTTTGIALERIAPEGPSNDAANWTSSLAPSGGTPGARNSVYLPPGESPAEPGLVADPSPFNASIGTQIRYTLAADAALVRLRIFDGAGRLVRTLEDAALGGSTRTGTLTWQGRDDANQPLRIGIYILLLEALDVQGGRTEAYKKAVVLARDL